MDKSIDKISIDCPCGNSYESIRGRYHTCPKCKFVWNTAPHISYKGELKIIKLEK